MRAEKVVTEAETERWVETMPILACILRSGKPRCGLHGTEFGEVERETEWGVLYRCGDHYTLCAEPYR